MSNHKEEIEFVKAFGANLRRIRLSKDITMQELAFNTEMDYSQISRIEHGKINTRISTANILAKALDVPVKELFDFNKEEE